MIEFSRSYKSSDGRCYATLDEAQKAEIQALFDGIPMDGVAEVAKLIVENKVSIVDILTLNDSSRPKARGQKKPRKTKAPEPELLPPQAIHVK